MAIKTFSKEDIISDILLVNPAAAEVMQAYGLMCAGCHISSHETLSQGAAAHGMPEDEIDLLVEDLNAIKTDSDAEKITITARARKAILSFQEEENAQGQGLKIVINKDENAVDYFLDFLPKPPAGDACMLVEDIKLYLAPRCQKLLAGGVIDFVDDDADSGFLIALKTA